jgi:hypothetical protein
MAFQPFTPPFLEKHMNALLLLPLLIGGAGDISFDVKGDVVQVIKSAPFEVIISEPGDLFFWTLPAGVKASEENNILKVTSAPVGEVILQVRVVKIDWEAKRVNQKSGTIKLRVGALPDDPDDPDKPDPPPTGCAGKTTDRAKEVCGWIPLVPTGSRGVRGDLSKVYTELASGLESGRFINYSQATVWFKAEQGRILSTQQLRDDWAKVGGRIAQMVAGAGNNRLEVIKVYRDIAEGLNAN